MAAAALNSFMSRCEEKLIAEIKSANDSYGLFKPGDRILLGLSGGKDSLSLLKLLSHFQLDIYSVFVDFFSSDDSKIKEHSCLYSNYQHINSGYLEKYKHKKNLCFSCAKQRRRVLVETANDLGIENIALGHHKNDVVETLLLNQFFSREICTMKPKQPLFNGQFHIIRPMFSIDESLLSIYAAENSFKISHPKCGEEGHTKRQMVKDLLLDLSIKHPKIDIIDNIFAACHNVNTEFLP